MYFNNSFKLILFFENLYNSGKINKVILPTIGIIASASSLGFIAIIIVFAFWIWKNYKLKNTFYRHFKQQSFV